MSSSSSSSPSSPSSPPTSPSPSSSTRYGRINSIAANSSAQHDANTDTQPTLNGNGKSDGNGHVATPSSASGFATPVAQSFQLVASRAEEALHKVAHRQPDQPAGRLAQWILRSATSLSHRIHAEIFSRTNAIGGLDNMWLLIDNISAFNPVCTATYTFQHGVDPDRLRQAILRQIDSFPKYAQRLTHVGRRWHGALFVDDPDFDIHRHVKVQQLPGHAGRAEFEAFASRFVAQPWDFGRPLWEICLLDNYHDPATGARGAAVVRGHHTLSDGQGFVMSQLFITSLGPKLESTMNQGAQLLSEARRGTARPSRISKRLRPLDRFHGTLPLQLLMLGLYWSTALATLLAELAGSVTMALTVGYYFLATFWRQRFVTASYAGPRKAEKELSWSRSFPLSDVKLVSRAFSGPEPGGWTDLLLPARKRSAHPRLVGHHLTVNDVVCTIIADVIQHELDAMPHQPGWTEAIKRLARRCGPDPIGIMVPISIRAPGDWSMRNLSTGSIAYLPATRGLSTDRAEMHKRLHASRRALTVLKNSLLPKLAFWSIQLTGQVPVLFPVPFALLPNVRSNPLRPVAEWITSLVLGSFTAVVTNVPCPSRQRITLAGQEIVQWTALPPQAGRGTLGIGICSYAGEVVVCVSADRVEASEGVARRLTEGVERRWDEYVAAARALVGEGGDGGRGEGERRR